MKNIQQGFFHTFGCAIAVLTLAVVAGLLFVGLQILTHLRLLFG